MKRKGNKREIGCILMEVMSHEFRSWVSPPISQHQCGCKYEFKSTILSVHIRHSNLFLVAVRGIFWRQATIIV